jgi:hypothetical protein
MGKEARMVEPWAREEMSAADLSDRRLNARLVEVLSQLGSRPTASIPAACGGHAEMTAAYRLFDNESVSFERILAPHVEAARRRVALQSAVVLAQDTTEMDLTRPERQVAGVGPLDSGPRRGMLLHLLHAFSDDGTPLGTLRATPWMREAGAAGAPSSGGQRAAIPIEEKESCRWVETLRHAWAEARRSPGTHMICVADSEADIHEVLVEAVRGPNNADWIVRSCQNRVAQTADGESTARRLRELALAQAVLFTSTIQVRGRKAKVGCEKRRRRQPRQSRRATVEVRAAARVVLRAPWRPPDRRLPPVTVNVALVREVHPPDDDEPVEWLLLTSLPVEEAAQAREVIRLYCVRWMIEVFFRVLKTGCRVEDRRFERIERFQSCLAIYLVVAWRTLYVCRLGRACPETDCEAIFDPAEWKAAWTIARRSNPPAKPPPLGEMILLVAEFGGYVPRKNSPPGPQTVWLGLQRAHDFALCWNRFGPETRKDVTLV